MPTTTYIENLGEPEGPAFGPDSTLYFVEMANERGSVMRAVDGVTSLVCKTAGRPNGLAIDGDGNIWVAEARDGSVVCLDPSGRQLKKISGDSDGRFLWPNDLAFGPDGMLYLTDSGIIDVDFIDGLAIRSDFATIPYDGRVYQIDPKKGVVTRVIDRGFRFTNGIAFDSKGCLYVAETLSGIIFRYDLDSPSLVREEFVNVLPDTPSSLFRGPDGFAFDNQGNLYCAVYNEGTITVVNSSGTITERISSIGSKPTNVAFDITENAIYVTEVANSCIYVIQVPYGGLPLHRPSLIL